MKAQNFTIKDAEKIMTPVEMSAFIKNLYLQNGNDMAISYLKRSKESFEDFLSCAFIWADTSEGMKYWEDIIERSLVK